MGKTITRGLSPTEQYIYDKLTNFISEKTDDGDYERYVIEMLDDLIESCLKPLPEEPTK